MIGWPSENFSCLGLGPGLGIGLGLGPGLGIGLGLGPGLGPLDHIVAERALATQSIVFRHIDLRLEDLVIFIHDIGTLAYGFTKTIIEISFDDGHFEIR